MAYPRNVKNRATDWKGMKDSFGFTQIPKSQKQTLVNGVFDSVADNYDLMNDLMSMGLHRYWKNIFITWLSPPSVMTNWTALDVAGGTGDIAFRILEAGRYFPKVTLLDINASMLSVGKMRAEKKKLCASLNFVEANAEELPFLNQHFNAYTIAFGIRNVPNMDQALKEAYRVLKPGGRFLCLEFSELQITALDRLYDRWSFNAIPFLGKIFTGSAEPYQYLVESIRKFPRQSDFAKMIKSVGFSHVSWRSLSGGIAAIHSGWKL